MKGLILMICLFLAFSQVPGVRSTGWRYISSVNSDPVWCVVTAPFMEVKAGEVVTIDFTVSSTNVDVDVDYIEVHVVEESLSGRDLWNHTWNSMTLQANVGYPATATINTSSPSPDYWAGHYLGVRVNGIFHYSGRPQGINGAFSLLEIHGKSYSELESSISSLNETCDSLNQTQQALQHQIISLDSNIAFYQNVSRALIVAVAALLSTVAILVVWKIRKPSNHKQDKSPSTRVQ